VSHYIPLRNDNHVYILGAGYSAARGLPLIANFMNRMRDAAIWCESNHRQGEAEAIHEVLRFRLNAAAAAYRVPIDLENIEELFSLASASSKEIVSSMKVSIAATLAFCAEKYPSPHIRFGSSEVDKADLVGHADQDGADHLTRHMPMYDVLALRLLLGLHPERSSVITFNYDDLVEQSIARLGGAYNFGFSQAPKLKGAVPYDKNGLPILKLHGSVTWSNTNGEFTVHKDYASVVGDGLVPEIIPPTWNKSIANQLAEVWFSAISRLSTATKIFIIGFSMPKTDMHFRYLLAAGMKENVSLREIVFVDPAADISKRVAELLDQREVLGNRVRFVSKRLEELVGESVAAVPGRYVPVNLATMDEIVFGKY
jgi:hypothetical protein